MTIELFDPTTSPLKRTPEMAQRSSNFEHPIVGLLENSKPGSEDVLRRVASSLEEDFGPPLEVVFVSKPNASRTAPNDLVDLIAQRCHFALVGVGD